MKCFLIHYTPLIDRLYTALNALRTISNDVTVIDCWDSGKINLPFYAFKDAEMLWYMSVTKILPILEANAGYPEGSISRYDHSLWPTWLKYRPLRDGEISVCLKHYYAISAIALSDDKYGIIAEDDIILKSTSGEQFLQTMNELSMHAGDYLDLAGGCSLKAASSARYEYIETVVPPSTRTNACYAISKKGARFLANNFLPFIMPIDWHLTLLLNMEDKFSCFWVKEPVFLHGTETGYYQSWRLSNS